MNKIRVIDLLNKIANNELPNKTKFKVFPSDESEPYICEFSNIYHGTIWCGEDEIRWDFKIDNMRILNYKVEIIEENKPIEKISGLHHPSTERLSLIREDIGLVFETIDLLIDKVNELERERNK